MKDINTSPNVIGYWAYWTGLTLEQVLADERISRHVRYDREEFKRGFKEAEEEHLEEKFQELFTQLRTAKE